MSDALRDDGLSTDENRRVPIIEADSLLQPPRVKQNTPVERRRSLMRPAFFIICAMLFGAYAFQLWVHATSSSATTDEPFHVFAGYRYWQCGDYGINPEHPPLLKLIAALPLLRLRGLANPALPCGTALTPKMEGYQASQQFLAENGASRVLIPGRMAVIGFSMLLALLVFLAAWEMFGRVTAAVALALLAFEPNLIAHGSLITTDMALTATMFATVYAVYRFCQRPGVGRLLLAGLATGMMLSVKHSAILVLPVLVALVAADTLWLRRDKAGIPAHKGGKLLSNMAALGMVFLLGLVILWASYGFRHSALPDASSASISVNDYFRLTPHPEAASSPSGLLLQVIDRLHIFPASYNFGLADVIANGSRTTFLLGKIYPTGRWFYFPVAFSIKSSIALLLLLPLGLLTWKLYRCYPREMLFLLLPALAYFAISMTWRINIGVRHILPVYPFFIVVAAAGACALARRHRAFVPALGILLLSHSVVSARTSPDYLAFGNAFWGGTNNTYRLLHDSNVEWEQNLDKIDEYLKREGIRDCWIAAFGGAELLRLHNTCRVMHGVLGTPPQQIIEPTPTVIEGTVLLSSTVLPPLGGGEYAQFAGREPDEMIGGSILVFRGRFEVPVAAAMSHAGRAVQLSFLKRFDEAIASGQKAVELAPDDPRTHASLGRALAGAGRNSEARQELVKALALTRSDPVFYQPIERAVRRVLQFLP